MFFANKLEMIHKALVVLAAVVVAYCLQYAIPADARMYYTMNIFPLIGVLLFSALFRKYFPEVKDFATENRLGFAVTAILSLALSVAIVQGAQVIEETFYDPLSIHLVCAVVFLAIPIFIGLQRMWVLCNRPSVCMEYRKGASRVLTLRWCLVVFFVMLLCWVPYFLACYPGLFCYDMATEYKHYTSQFFTTHFPFLHVLFVGAVVDVGTEFLGGGMISTRESLCLRGFSSCSWQPYLLSSFGGSVAKGHLAQSRCLARPTLR